MQIIRIKDLSRRGQVFEQHRELWYVRDVVKNKILLYLLSQDSAGRWLKTRQDTQQRKSNAFVGFRPCLQQLNDCYMSKIEAYLCDSCGEIKHHEAVIGFSPERDLFDQRESFKEINNPAKASFHYCTDCFHSKVYVPAINTADRQKDEEAYKAKVKELLFVLKNQALMKCRK